MIINILNTTNVKVNGIVDKGVGRVNDGGSAGSLKNKDECYQWS